MTDKCKCTMAQSLTGDGCRCCQPQEYIENLQTWLEEERAENEKLQAQVAMLRKYIAWVNGLVENWSDDEIAYRDSTQSGSDWLAQHDQQVRDEAYSRGRQDMHDAVMAEWDKPAQVGDAHIGDRLRKLKGA